MLATILISAAATTAPVGTESEMSASPLTLTPVQQQQPATPAERPGTVAPRADDPWGVRDTRFGPRAGDWEFTLSGGGLHDHNFSTATYNLELSIGHFLTDNLEIAFRQGILFSDVGASDFRGTSAAAIDWHFGDGRFRPFVGAQFGGIYGDQKDEFFAGPEVGLKWFVHPQTFLFARGEYQFFFSEIGDADDNFRDGDFVINFGIGFLF